MRLSFGNFQNGFIAFVQQILGHLGYPYAIRRRQPSMNLGDAIGSNVFRRVTLKNQAGHLLPGPVRQNKFVRTESQLDRYLTFGTRQKSSDRLAQKGLHRKAERC